MTTMTTITTPAIPVGTQVNCGGDRGIVTMSGCVYRNGSPVPDVRVTFPTFGQTVRYLGGQVVGIQVIG